MQQLSTIVLLVAGAALALVYGARLTGAAPSAGRSLAKTGAVAALALAGWRMGVPPAIVVGLAAGAAGDFFLSRAGQRAFLAGMAFFAAGHGAYAVSFWPGVGLAPGWPVTAALLLFGLSTEVWLAPHAGALRWPVRAYVAVILVMVWAASGGAGPLALAGAGLFVLSDLLLAVDLFRLRSGPQWLGRLVWACYWSGQALILAGSTGG